MAAFPPSVVFNGIEGNIMLITHAAAPQGQLLSEEIIKKTIREGLDGQFSKRKVLVLIPDHTRSLPLPFLFRTMVEVLQDTSKLDFMVALGTHPALSEAQLNHLVGITAEERNSTFAHVGLLNHAWDDPDALTTLGVINEEKMCSLAGDRWHDSLPRSVDVKLNKAVLEYDHVLILGPTFPHEVVGFSGGAKYLFPGISGPDMINATHWLGALAGVVGTIGIKDTPVRAMIHEAASYLQTPLTLLALVVEGHDLSGLFIGDYQSAWSAAVDLSAQRHIRWCEKPFQRVLSCAPAMYDELWTAAKAMYKLEPAVAEGGEVIIYAPHLDVVSHVHGKYIYQIGYHILPYFLQDWQRFQDIPLGVLAHSTHVRGSGRMVDGVEKANVKVTLASKISAEDCARLNLGYMDPAKINVNDWQDKEAEGILYVPKAGEILYRVK
jgi:nickel-dependent lactate racemase